MCVTEELRWMLWVSRHKGEGKFYKVGRGGGRGMPTKAVNANIC